MATTPPRPSRTPSSADPAPAASAHPNDQPPLPSECLLCGRKIVEIEHNGTIYRLQATRLGKLILTK